MARGYEVLSMLIPQGGWELTGDTYEGIQFLECEPITKKEFEEYIEARHFYYCSILKPKVCGSCNTPQLLDGYKYCHNPDCKRDPWYNASVGFFIASQKAIVEEEKKEIEKAHVNRCNNPNCDCGDIEEPVIQGGAQEIRFNN